MKPSILSATRRQTLRITSLRIVRFTSSEGGEASLLLRDETIGQALVRSRESQIVTFGR